MKLKVFTFLAVFAFVASSHAGQFYTIGFGKDGASSKISPKKTSAKDANEVFEALNLNTRDGHKGIETDDGELDCSNNNCGLSVFSKIASNVKEKEITFSGKIAQAIFEALDDSTRDARVGGISKQVANLTCTQVLVSGGHIFKCTFTDVGIISL